MNPLFPVTTDPFAAASSESAAQAHGPADAGGATNFGAGIEQIMKELGASKASAAVPAYEDGGVAAAMAAGAKRGQQARQMTVRAQAAAMAKSQEAVKPGAKLSAAEIASHRALPQQALHSHAAYHHQLAKDAAAVARQQQEKALSAANRQAVLHGNHGVLQKGQKAKPPAHRHAGWETIARPTRLVVARRRGPKKPAMKPHWKVHEDANRGHAYGHSRRRRIKLERPHSEIFVARHHAHWKVHEDINRGHDYRGRKNKRGAG